ncbi:hypothetical protein Q1695_009931 [Nippostrongylus brasiliensis]|nr:hypothetical protein Q1695_009931 [Nippostrongylus brasiliensis]
MEDTVRRFLEAFHIQVKDKWMQDTVNFIRSHGKGENEDDLRRAVFEQFLHSNLADSYEPLSKVPVGALKAIDPYDYPLLVLILFYVVSVLDTCRSCYDQYRERIENDDDLSWFHGEDEMNSQEKESRLRTSTSNSRRLLKVKLTDGQNEVHGIEYGGKIDLDQMAIAGTKASFSFIFSLYF